METEKWAWSSKNSHTINILLFFLNSSHFQIVSVFLVCAQMSASIQNNKSRLNINQFVILFGWYSGVIIFGKIKLHLTFSIDSSASLNLAILFQPVHFLVNVIFISFFISWKRTCHVKKILIVMVLRMSTIISIWTTQVWFLFWVSSIFLFVFPT